MTELQATLEKERMVLHQKAKNLELRLKQVREQEEKLKAEIEEVDIQIAYYDGLTKDIKKDIHPPKLDSLLHDMRRA